MKSTQSDTPRGRENFSTFNGENKDIGLDAAYLFGATYITRHMLTREHWPPHMTSHMLAAALSPPLFHSKRQFHPSPTPATNCDSRPPVASSASDLSELRHDQDPR